MDGCVQRWVLSSNKIYNLFRDMHSYWQAMPKWGMEGKQHTETVSLSTTWEAAAILGFLCSWAGIAVLS